jgi:predicted ATPase
MADSDNMKLQPQYRLILMGRPRVEILVTSPFGGEWREATIGTNPEAVELLALWVLSRELVAETDIRAEGRAPVAIRSGGEVTRDWLAMCLFPDIFNIECQNARNKLSNVLRYMKNLRVKPLTENARRERGVVRLRFEPEIDVLKLREAARLHRHEEVERLASQPLLEGMAYVWLQEPAIQRVRMRCDIWYLEGLFAIAHELRIQMEDAAKAGRTEDAAAIRAEVIMRLDRAYQRLIPYGDLGACSSRHPLRRLDEAFSKLCWQARYVRLNAPEMLPDLPYDGALPQPLTSFVGRAREKSAVKRLVQPGSLVTIVGPGGSGKTRLAVQIATEMRADTDLCSDGAWFVDLAPGRDTRLVAHTVLTTVNPKAQPMRDPVEALVNFWGQQKALLVLDNCEPLREECASLVRALLTDCPNLSILATSQEAINVEAERVWPIPALAYPDPDRVRASLDLQTFLMEYDAIRLFVTRARMNGIPFSLSGNEEGLTRICMRLEGNPLAIELLAARADLLSVSDMVARLEQPFKLLERGGETHPGRHHTMWNTIDWSYNLLTPAEQRLLVHLAVFVGTWTLAAAEFVCRDEEAGVPEVLELVESLKRKSLVRVERGIENTHRFRLLQLIRDYSLERLSTTATAEMIRGRHLLFYTTFAESLGLDVNAHALENAQQRLQQEWENMQGALDYAVSREDGAHGLRLAGALGRFWYVGGYNRQGTEWLDKLLPLRHPVPVATVAVALMSAGNLALQRHDYDRAFELYTQCLDLQTTDANRAGIMKALGSLGNVAVVRGELEAAKDYYERSLEISRDLGAHRVTSRTLDNLAGLASRSGDLARAIWCHEESLSIFRQERDPESLITTLNNLAYTHLLIPNYLDAVRCLQESLQICLDVDTRHGLLHCLFLCFLLAVKQNHMESAACLLGGEEAHRARLGLPRHPDAATDFKIARDSGIAFLGIERWAALTQQGRSLSLDELIDLARQLLASF